MKPRPKTVLTLLLIAVAISAQAQREKIVEQPRAVFANTFALEIAKVTLSDTETVLDVDAYFRPGSWIRIASDSYLLADGKKYMIREGEGIDLDSLFWMPQSGEAEFTLIFEPLPAETTIFDFIESDCNDCFKIYGIDLMEKYKEKPIKTTLIGKVNNRPQSKRLILAKANADLRVNQFSLIHVDSIGNFRHTLHVDDMEAYTLIFAEEYENGAWHTEIFFPDTDTVYIQLHPENERVKNNFTGGKLNKDYYDYYLSRLTAFNQIEKEREQLRVSGNYYTKEFSLLIDELQAETNETRRDSLGQSLNNLAESGKHLTPQGQQLEDEYKTIGKKQRELSLEWIVNNCTIAGYYLLIEWLNYPIDKSKLIDAYYNVYAKKFPNHPYTKQAKELIVGIELKRGDKFIDFTAPDSEGNDHTLSELINGKVAMINLWASWCGPCRRHGKELIPVYEQYKEKGFTVVGIAREYDKNNMINAIKKEGYPWFNLLELNDAQNIWAKYGVPNAGGRLVLVDKEGVILAVDPAIEETIKIIEEELSK
ncbi:MAG: TlpA disulfide reductase family protein [Bacteroidota bacterium]|nr:TlpA disulfide reductase family protein [Bacteroidota bacterium]